MSLVQNINRTESRSSRILKIFIPIHNVNLMMAFDCLRKFRYVGGYQKMM